MGLMKKIKKLFNKKEYVIEKRRGKRFEVINVFGNLQLVTLRDESGKKKTIQLSTFKAHYNKV